MTGTFDQFSAKGNFFYVPSVIKSMLHSKNILGFLYLAFNYGVSYLFFYSINSSISEGLLGAAIVFLFPYLIMLSPIGEAIIRIFQGIRKIENGKKSLIKLSPLLTEVLSLAKAEYPDFYLDKHFKFYLKDDPAPRAYTIGRRTFCVTTGLLNCSDEQMKAVLSHEIYHLIHRETDYILLLSSGNFFLTVFAMMINLAIIIGQTMLTIVLSIIDSKDGFFVSLLIGFCSLLQLIFVNSLLWIWTNISVSMVRSSYKKSEFNADAFAFELGYGEGLLSYYHRLSGYEGMYAQARYNSYFEFLKEKTKTFSVITEKQPKIEKRILKIEEMFRNYEVIEADLLM